LDQLLQQFERILKRFWESPGEQNRIVGGSPATTRRSAFIHSSSFHGAAARNRRIVGDVVGMTHEGVYRRQRIALAERRTGSRSKSFSLPSGDVRQRCTPPQLERVFAHNNFLRSRAQQPQFARLGIAGRRCNTS